MRQAIKTQAEYERDTAGMTWEEEREYDEEHNPYSERNFKFTEKEEEGFQALLKLKKLEDAGSEKVEIEKQLRKVRALGKELGFLGPDEKEVTHG